MKDIECLDPVNRHFLIFPCLCLARARVHGKYIYETNDKS